MLRDTGIHHIDKSVETKGEGRREGKRQKLRLEALKQGKLAGKSQLRRNHEVLMKH